VTILSSYSATDPQRHQAYSAPSDLVAY